MFKLRMRVRPGIKKILDKINLDRHYPKTRYMIIRSPEKVEFRSHGIRPPDPKS
jgi:hypothetical protein